MAHFCAAAKTAEVAQELKIQVAFTYEKCGEV